MTLRTVPVNSIPGFKSSILNTSVRNKGAGISSRISRPGCVSPAKISANVSSPTDRLSASFSTDNRVNFSTASSVPSSFSESWTEVNISFAIE